MPTTLSRGFMTTIIGKDCSKTPPHERNNHCLQRCREHVYILSSPPRRGRASSGVPRLFVPARLGPFRRGDRSPPPVPKRGASSKNMKGRLAIPDSVSCETRPLRQEPIHDCGIPAHRSKEVCKFLLLPRLAVAAPNRKEAPGVISVAPWRNRDARRSSWRYSECVVRRCRWMRVALLGSPRLESINRHNFIMTVSL